MERREYRRRAGVLIRAEKLALWLAVLLLPFNSVPWYGRLLGELSEEAWVGAGAVLVALVGLRVLCERRLPVPARGGWLWLLMFSGWAALGALAGALVFGGEEFKGRSPMERAVKQVVVLAFAVAAALGAWLVLRRYRGVEGLRAFRRAMLWSLLVPGLVALVEACWLLTGDGIARSLLDVVSGVVHRNLGYGRRLRSVAGEASWFGIWFAFALPWLLSVGQRWKALAGIGLLVFGVALGLSFSRFAWVAATLVGGGFAFSAAWLARAEQGRWAAWAAGVLLMAGLGIAALVDWPRWVGLLSSATFEEENPHWLSNVSRIGMQAAAVRMGLAYPFTGVGWGGFGFHFSKFLPEWAYASPEVVELASDVEGTVFAPTYGLWARLVAETGFVGLALFGACWVTFLRCAWRRARRAASRGAKEDCELWLPVFWSGLACVLTGFALDSLRFGGYWVLLGAGWAAMAGEEGARAEP